MTLLAPALEGAAKTGTVESNGLTLAYEQFGQDRDPALLLIMGLGAQLRAWPDAFCQALADHGLRVIRFDNRDIGLSTRLDTLTDYERPRRAMLQLALRRRIHAPYSLQDMAADAWGLLDGLDIPQAHIVGASMGGMIAQIMAADQPQRILSLTLMMTTSGARGLPRGKLRVLRRLGASPKTDDEDTVVREMARNMRMLSGPQGLGESAWQDEARKAYRRCYYPPGVARQLLAVLAAPSRAGLLWSIKQPTLVIHGSADPLLPVKHGRDMAQNLPNARYEEIAGMGHGLPPRHLAAFVDMIVELVQTAEHRPWGPDKQSLI